MSVIEARAQTTAEEQVVLAAVVAREKEDVKIPIELDAEAMQKLMDSSEPPPPFPTIVDLVRANINSLDPAIRALAAIRLEGLEKKRGPNGSLVESLLLLEEVELQLESPVCLQEGYSV